MICPTCTTKMDDAFGSFGFSCDNCGCVVCHKCGTVHKTLDEAEIWNRHTGNDYLCKNEDCDATIYSVDLYPE